MADDKRKYLTLAFDPEMYESVVTEANRRGAKPAVGAMFIIADWFDTQAERTNVTLTKRESMRLMVMAERRKREENESFLNEARYMAALIERGDPNSEDLAGKFRDLCEFLGVSPEEITKEAASNDYLKPAIPRSEMNETALIEILTAAPKVSRRNINKEWKERGLSVWAIERTKASLLNKGFLIATKEYADGWYWSLELRDENNVQA